MRFMLSIAVTDTCFLINWLRFRRRDDIFRLYQTIAIPLLVLDELGTTRSRLAEWITSRRIIFIPRINVIEIEAIRVVELAKTRSLPLVDPPEAYCLCIAKYRGYDVLTDNRAIKYIVREVEEFRNVKVLDSLDLLVSLYGSLRETLKSRVLEFSSDTGIRFSQRRLREYEIEI